MDYYSTSETRDAAESLVRELLRTITKRDFIYTVGSVINENLLAKEAVRRIFQEEVRAKKPDLKVVLGALNTINHFLGSHPSVGFLEIIEIVESLLHCYKYDTRKTIHVACGEAITRLFLTIYYEHNIMPSSSHGDLAERFKGCISKTALQEIVKSQEPALSFMWRQYRLKDWREQNPASMAQGFIDDFYIE